jgi:hypothetical protein
MGRGRKKVAAVGDGSAFLDGVLQRRCGRGIIL